MRDPLSGVNRYWEAYDARARAGEITTWLPDMRDLYEERLAIIEANGVPRAEAERQAFNATMAYEVGRRRREVFRRAEEEDARPKWGKR